MPKTASKTIRHLFTGAAFAALAMSVAPIVSAQDASLETVIDAFETLSREGDPDAMAKEAGTSPKKWSSVTPAYYADRASKAEALLATLDGLRNQGDGPESTILRHLLKAEINAHAFDNARIPFTGDSGFYTRPTYSAMRTRANSKDKAEAWIARLNDLPRYFDEQKANMRRGIDSGWTQHSDPLATAIEQIKAQIKTDPTKSTLFMPFESLSASSLSESEIDVLKQQGAAAVTRAMMAYEKLLAFMETEYAPAARANPGIASMEGGQSAYAMFVAHHTAGAGLTPEDIHEVGKTEVARIRAQMGTIIEEVEFDGTFEEFQTFLRTDPQFYSTTPEDLLEKAAEMSKRLDALLPRYFGKLPRLPYGVEAVPPAIAPGYTTGRYSGGDQEKGIAGTYLVNTYALDQRPLYELPALSAHEAVPGHHLQISLAQELEDMPEFRKSYYTTTFGEGWGLYAEKLAGEAGFYRTPYERFGQLSYEMWRACRLVSDTGLHHYNWSREKAEECFIKNTALAPLNIQTEVTRYIGWPGQATAYKVGELKILELRAAAKEALGEAFDIRDFHDVLLGAGSMPLDALEARIMAWVEGEQHGTDSTE